MKKGILFSPPADYSLHSLLNEHEVSHQLGISVASLRGWRLIRQGPKFVKIGAAVRYKPADVAAWIDSRPTGGERVQR